MSLPPSSREKAPYKDDDFDDFDDDDDDDVMMGPLGGGVEMWNHQICDAFLRSLPPHLGVRPKRQEGGDGAFIMFLSLFNGAFLSSFKAQLEVRRYVSPWSSTVAL